MITIRDLQEAIAECEGERNPNANTCIKLAAYYTILDHMTTKEDPGHSYAPAPVTTTSQPSVDPNEYVGYSGNSEFAHVIEDKRSEDVLKVVDELMSTLQVLNPRLYDGVMRRLT